jgi:UDP-N-acetylglucosamine--N-acetylmuramyl-(pentapeptide) pyrophosphoryl-undecaprenol N-acetylglucosamine transferase
VIEFVGIKTGKENDLVPREGYRLHHVRSMGIKRSLSPSNIKAFWLALTSPYSKETVGIIKEFRPDIVIGTGGYACWPIMAAAVRMGIPTAVHESNSLPGLAVRRLQKKVDRIWINFDATRELLDVTDRVVRVGNPLRSDFGALGKEEARARMGLRDGQRLILSFGGSLGSSGVTGAALEVMEKLVAGNEKLVHIHSAGKGNYEEALADFRARGLSAHGNCQLVDYVYDMPVAMAAADIVIGRAGAMTISELALMKKASILIPSPYVADNHQYKNAKTLADADATILIEEKTLKEGTVYAAVERLLNSPEELDRLGSNIEQFADVDANRTVWMEILQLLGKA